MANDLNEVSLIGRLGADPEIRRTQDGRPIATMSVATSENWIDRNTSEKREKTEWHRVVVFNEGLCKVIEQYVHKGDRVFIRGKLSTRKWEDQQGQTRYSTEIVLQGFDAKLQMLGSAKGSGYQPGGNGPQDHGYDSGHPANGGGNAHNTAGPASDFPSGANAGGSNAGGMGAEIDDEIPF